MSTQSVEYTSCSRLCCGELPTEVVLCVPSDLILYGVGFLNATMSIETEILGLCNQRAWRYVFSYNDSLLIEEGILSGTDIEGVICNTCLNTWVTSLNTVTQADDLSATGTVQADAYPLLATVNRFTTITVITGIAAILPPTAAWPWNTVVVRNEQGSGGNLSVFPAVGEYINSEAVNVSYLIPPGTTTTFYKNTAIAARWFTT